MTTLTLSLSTVDPTWGWATFIARATYRPNVRLAVGPGPALLVTMDVLDTYSRCPTVVCHRLPLPTYPLTDQDRSRFLRDLLHQVENHESDEWLRVDGIMLFDPHTPGERLL